MKFPLLFRQVHQKMVFSTWLEIGRPRFVRVVLQEPLAPPTLTDAECLASADLCVEFVEVECWDEQGVMHYKPAREADLKVAYAWAERHKDTPIEDFNWVPELVKGTVP